MRFCENGVYRDATKEELEAKEKWEQSQNRPQPTLDERMTAVEAEVSDLNCIISGKGVPSNAQ